MSSWLVFLGTKDEAKKYDAEIILSAEYAWSGMRGPVFSLEDSQEELLKDKGVTLEISKRQIINVGKVVGDKFKIRLKNKVILK